MNKKVLLILSRSPAPPLTGQKKVIDSTIKSITSLGYNLKIVNLVSNDSKTQSKYLELETPKPMEVLINILTKFFIRKLSLNECLFYKKKNFEILDSIIEEFNPDIIINDMIRTSPYAMRYQNKIWVSCIDDLLSIRYLELSKKASDSNVFGYFSERHSSFVNQIINYFSTYIYKIETGVVRKREIEITQSAKAVKLVSQKESNYLQALSNKKVYFIPMSIEINKLPALDEKHGLVFIGSLNYWPNKEAIYYFLKEIYPLLREKEALNILGGDITPELEEDPFISEKLKFNGYIEVLQNELIRYEIFLAPIMTGTGIKTKVLDAMASGLPVVGTKVAFDSIGVTHMKNCVVANTPEEFSNAVSFLKSNPTVARQIGYAGMSFVQNNYSQEIIQEKWNELLKSINQKSNLE